jgi:uracil-DNA glycosylase family 4
MSRILFIGSNPSQKSSKTVPFWHDTNSRKVLDKWFSHVQGEVTHTHFLNVSNQVTPGNRPLKTSEIKVSLDRLEREITLGIRPDYIITLGKTAEKALVMMKITETGYDYYAMPHPSGLNRQLNDPKFIQEKIKGLQNYLKSLKDQI